MNCNTKRNYHYTNSYHKRKSEIKNRPQSQTAKSYIIGNRYIKPFHNINYILNKLNLVSYNVSSLSELFQAAKL